MTAAAASVRQWRTAQFPCETRGRRHQLTKLNIRLGLVQRTICRIRCLEPPSSAPRDASRGLRPLPGPDHLPKRSVSMSAIHCSKCRRSCRENCSLSSPRASFTRMPLKSPTGQPRPSGFVPCAKTASGGGAPTDLAGSWRIGRPLQPIALSSKESRSSARGTRGPEAADA